MKKLLYTHVSRQQHGYRYNVRYMKKSGTQKSIHGTADTYTGALQAVNTIIHVNKIHTGTTAQCTACGGQGYYERSQSCVTCTICNGTGHVNT